MMTVTTRPGVNPSYLVRRSLGFKCRDDSSLSALSAELEAQIGFESIAWDVARQRLTLAYDASKLDLEALLAKVVAHGWSFAPGRLNRYRRSWFAFSDQNIRDSANDQQSSCCSQSPLRHR